jgi:hypothetical protein
MLGGKNWSTNYTNLHEKVYGKGLNAMFIVENGF